MSEFGRIDRYLRPLAGDGSMGLRDDAARFAGQVITKDLLVEGVHFRTDDPLDLVARKALRVNQSDLIAKGARPAAYLLGLTWPRERSEDGFARFCEGLGREQEETGLILLGGDTTSGPVLMVSITMFGTPLSERPILRDGGAPGNLLFVSGTIGDGLLGLEAAERGDQAGALPYHLPAIPFGAEALVAAHAKAAIDVSDGLIADAGHLSVESRVDLVIDPERVPLSPAGRAAAEEGRLGALLCGGDDYQTLLLAPAAARTALSPHFAVIGRAEAPRDPAAPAVRAPDGSPFESGTGGWDHFRG